MRPSRLCNRLLAVWMLGACAIGAPGAGAATLLQPELEALQAYSQARDEIRAGRYDQAEILLERTLMLHPEHAEARIDLVLLMASRGQLDAALALLKSLLDDPRTEPPYVQALNELQLQLQRGDIPQLNPYAIGPDGLWAGRSAPGLALPGGSRAGTGLRAPQGQSAASQPAAPWRAEVSYAASTNPMARTSAGTITLTPVEGPVTLPLSTTPHPGRVLGTSLSYNTETHGAEFWAQHADIDNARNAGRAVFWARLPSPEGWLPGAGFQNMPPVMAFVQTLRALDGQRRVLTGLSSTSGAQRLSLTRYQDATTSDRGWLVRLDHSQRKWLGADWLASLERSNSTVGVQGYWRTSLGAELPLGEGRKLMGQWAHHQDSYAYSELLQQGAKRHLNSVYVAFEQQHRIEGEKILIWRVFRDERRSNLELFTYKDFGVQFSLVHNWR